jgi:choline dehydrogenase
MVYVRGNAKDYDEWESAYGCKGWAYRDVLPYFIRSEGNESLGLPAHGNDGQLWVTECRYRHPLTMAYIRAGQELGYLYLMDMSGMAEQEGVGFWQRTIHDGRRGNTSWAYLSRVIDNERLALHTEATVEKILIENGCATVVRYSIHGRRGVEARASREVIVTAGALATPKLLMQSGIGPQRHLDEFGIGVKADNPHVGKNYHDHLQVIIAARTPGIPSMLREGTGLRKFINGAEWMANQEGAVLLQPLRGRRFLRSRQGRQDRYPAHRMAAYDSAGVGVQGTFDGITFQIGDDRPRSRGDVLLGGPDAADPVRLHARYLTADGDIEAQVRAFKLGLRIFEAPSLNKITESVNPTFSNGEEIAAYIKQHACTVFHPVGTCRMGATAEDSAVDLELKVRGVANLRIADASVMPRIPTGNTNAPTVMIA